MAALGMHAQSAWDQWGPPHPAPLCHTSITIIAYMAEETSAPVTSAVLAFM